MAQISRASFVKLETQFSKFIGPDAVASLTKSMTSRPVLAISGDQATGKSTLGKRLAKALGGKYSSAGSLFRQHAAKKGISVADLSRQAAEEPQVDVAIDYQLCSLVAAGDPDGVLVLEGRQPAIMTTYMELLGKTNTFKVFLSCTVAEQALRYIQREIGADVAKEVKATLPERKFESLCDVTDELSNMAISKIEPEDLAKLQTKFENNQSRDEDDLKRYAELYGFDQSFDFRNRKFYNQEMDITKNQAEDTFQQAVALIKAETDWRIEE